MGFSGFFRLSPFHVLLLCIAFAVEHQCSIPANAAPATNTVPVRRPPPPLTNRPANLIHPATNSAQQAIAGIHLPTGFKIEVAAAAPLVFAPSAMAFDEEGRLFVAEMRDFPNNGSSTPHLGRVRRLEDRNGDGIFETSTVYADNLPLPSAIICYGGGVFVAAAPDIIYLKDTKGDGVADERRSVLTGFGSGARGTNANTLPCSFFWGMDNRIHASSGGMEGIITLVSASNEGALSISRNNFSFDPRNNFFFLETGPSTGGVCRDAYGRIFLTDFERPLRGEIYNGRYLLRNPNFLAAREMRDLASPGLAVRVARPTPAGSAYPAQAAAQDVVWLGSARGPMIYQGAAFPREYHGAAFLVDPQAHVVHALPVPQEIFGAPGPPAGAIRNAFLYSEDPAFHPMSAINTPDGCLLVADIRNSADSGQIYRIAPANYLPVKTIGLGSLKTRELLALFASTNAWQRDSAARLIYSRNDPDAVPLLTNMLLRANFPLARLLAMNALDAKGVLNAGQVARALKDPDPAIREAAILMAEKFARQGSVPEVVVAALFDLAADPSPRVRLQLAFTLGAFAHGGRIELLAQMLEADMNNPWIETAVWTSLGGEAGDLFLVLIRNNNFANSPRGRALINKLVTMIGARGRMDEVNVVLKTAATANLDTQTAFALLARLGEGLRRARSSLVLVDPQNALQPLYTAALNTALNDSAAEALRIQALRLLTESSYNYGDITDLLSLLFNSGQSLAVQSATVPALCIHSDPRIAPGLFARWRVLAPATKMEVCSGLLQRPERIPALLQALENEIIQPADFSPAQLNLLRTYRNPDWRAQAEKILRPFSPERPGVFGQYLPALKVKGIYTSGRDIYSARCALCHDQPANGTASFGPDLGLARVKGKDYLLRNMIEPSRQMRPGYATAVIETKSADMYSGILKHDDLASVTLQQSPTNDIVLPRSTIETIEMQPWSYCPEGLEESLSVQDMASLLEYIALAP